MTELLLAGGGHAHLFVLETLARQRPPGVRVTLVSARRWHAYSGMLPGLIGGRYQADAISLDLARLAAAAGAQFVEGEVHAFSAAEQTVTLADGRQLGGDVVSLAVGSSVAGLDLTGVREHALLVKPIDRAMALAPALDAAAERHVGGTVHVAVVGGGAAGCELAWAARARLAARGVSPAVTIVERGASLVADRAPRVRRAVAAACRRLGVETVTGADVLAVTADAVQLRDGRIVRADLAIWAAGSRAAPWLAASGLPCDARGYVQVEGSLAAAGHPSIFAAGDTATPISWPATPKAGVYAVRAGPVLAANLLAAATGSDARATWTPQRGFLALLNTGDGRAIFSWRGVVLEGRLAMRLKDRIDGDFLARFASIG